MIVNWLIVNQLTIIGRGDEKLSNNKMEVIGRLNQLTLLHRMKIYQVAKESGVYAGQKFILDYIIKHDRCTQKEIAERMYVSQPSIAMSVKRMEKAELITREADEKDSRTNRLSATEKGKQLMEKCRKIFDSVDDDLFAGFTSEELETFKEYLDRMIVNISGKQFNHEDFCRLIAQEKQILSHDKKEEKQ